MQKLSKSPIIYFIVYFFLCPFISPISWFAPEAFADGSELYNSRSGETTIIDGKSAKIEMIGEAPYDKARKTFIISGGNNIIGLQQKDQYLTNNMSITVVTNEIPEAIKKLLVTGLDGTTSYSITAAQYMYTPKNLHATEYQKDDRPYAGWLFVRLQSSDRKENHLVISGFDVGVMGPASGADKLQILVHKLTGSTPPQGWANQISNQLGVNVFHIRAMNWRKEGKYIDNDLTAYGGLTLGNVNTHAQTGFIYRVGYNIPNDMAAMYISPGEMAGSLRRSNFSFYIFTGAETRLIAYDAFLDRGTVQKEIFGLALKGGLAVRYKEVEVGYMSTYTRKQFKTQPEAYTGFSGYFVRLNHAF